MKSIALFLTLFFLISLQSCITFDPMVTDIPLIQNKNDLRIDAGVSTMPNAFATISYGITNKWAVQGTGSFGYEGNYYYQLSAGSYMNHGNSLVSEFYGGFGVGKGFAWTNLSAPGRLEGPYQYYFAQYNFGRVAMENSNFEAGFGLKTGYLYSKLSDKNYYGYSSDFGPYDVNLNSGILIVPMGFIRFLKGNTKFNLKMGNNTLIRLNNFEQRLPYKRLSLSVGFNFHFPN